MPIGNITQTMSTISPPPHRGVDVQSVFVNKQEDFQDHLANITIDELNTLKDQLNTRIGEINSTATTMNGYATTSSAGASTATTKAGEASTSASEALTSRNQASTFASDSSYFETRARKWADNNYNVVVEAEKYSAKHWATEAQNATVNKVDKVTSTNNAIVRFDGTTGAVQNSAVTVDDNGTITTQGLRSTSPIYGIGYGTGSGGTVTQLTSKSTTVTLNKPCGSIIMNSEALAADASVMFTLYSSAFNLNAEDVLIVVPRFVLVVPSNYDVRVAWAGAEATVGNFVIKVTNISGVSRSEALELNFTVIRGARV